MDALGTLIASASIHNSASETPSFLAGKKFNHSLLGIPFLLRGYTKMIDIDIDIEIMFDIEHYSKHLT